MRPQVRLLGHRLAANAIHLLPDAHKAIGVGILATVGTNVLHDMVKKGLSTLEGFGTGKLGAWDGNAFLKSCLRSYGCRSVTTTSGLKGKR